MDIVVVQWAGRRRGEKSRRESENRACKSRDRPFDDEAGEKEGDQQRRRRFY